MRNLMALAAVVVLAAADASAQEAGPAPVARPDFSLVSGETVLAGRDMVSAQFGWPSIAFGYTHGINDKLDVGGRLELLYGFEGSSNTQFGMDFGAPIRSTVLRRDKISMQSHVDP